MKLLREKITNNNKVISIIYLNDYEMPIIMGFYDLNLMCNILIKKYHNIIKFTYNNEYHYRISTYIEYLLKRYREILDLNKIDDEIINIHKNINNRQRVYKIQKLMEKGLN